MKRWMFQSLFQRYFFECFYFYHRFTFLLQASSLLSFPFVHFPFTFIPASLLSPLPPLQKPHAETNEFICISDSNLWIIYTDIPPFPRRTLRAVRQLPSILLNARLTSLVVPIFERDFEGQLSSISRFLFLFFFIHNDISLVHFANVQSSLRGITNTFTNP